MDAVSLGRDTNGVPRCREDRGPELKLDDDEKPTYLAAFASLLENLKLVSQGEKLSDDMTFALLSNYGQFGATHVADTRHSCRVLDKEKQIVSCDFAITWYESESEDGNPYSSNSMKYEAQRIRKGEYKIIEESIQSQRGFE